MYITKMHLLIGSVVLVDRGINLQRNVWLVLILYGIYQSSIVYIEVLAGQGANYNYFKKKSSI